MGKDDTVRVAFIWPTIQSFGDVTRPSFSSRAVDITGSSDTAEKVFSAMDACHCNTGRCAYMLLLGWKTWMELCVFFSPKGTFTKLKEFRDVPILVDPSREYYVQAIADWDTIGSKCGLQPYGDKTS